MRKILVIIRREYIQGVRGKAFLVSTLLAPVFMFIFLVVPSLIIGLKTGEATRVAVVDETGRLFQPLRESVVDGPERERRERDARRGVAGAGVRGADDVERRIQTNFQMEEVSAQGRPLEEVKEELSRRVLDGKLDIYLVLPADILRRGEAELYARNTGDMITLSTLEGRLSRAVIEQRMRDENISGERVRELSEDVRVSKDKVTAGGTKKDDGGSFFFALGVGTFVLVAMLMYGQAILSAVVEEKTTRIVEVLFSSVDAFKLLSGKLVGVSLVAMTQFAIWAGMFMLLALYGAGAAGAMPMSLPTVPPQAYLYALLFFMLGFFVYSTIYAVIGAIVTTEKEASQIVVPVSLLPVVAIYLAFPVIRSPGSAFSFWVSMIPFFSPVTMLVRVVTETPPFWQVALSLLVGVLVVVAMIWVAARIYRTGMLMYGKRATVPEILRWIRQT